MMREKNRRIIVIGAGYAGLKAVEKLSKDAHNEVFLFDKNPYHFMQTDVYDLIANEYDFSRVTIDLFTYCEGFNANVIFKKEFVTAVDFEHNKVITQNQRFSYNYLVIAVGSRTKFMNSVKGLKEYGYGIKALHRAIYFKQRFESSLFKKIQEEGSVCKPLHIVVAGGGLSGVEIAAQMASFAKDFYRKNHYICRKLNIDLINSSSHILSGMDKKLVQSSQKKLKELGVNIITNRKVVEVKKSSVVLSQGEVLETDFMIYAGGVEPNALVHNLDLLKDKKGYIVSNNYLQVQGHRDVFAIGDCTTIYSDNNTPVAPTADIAEQMGELCAKNIQNLIKEKRLIEHKISSRGILIALGRGYASAKLFGFYLNGYSAYVIKKLVEKIYFFRLNRVSKKGCKKIFS